MELSWKYNFHRLTSDEKSRGETGTGYPDQDGVYVISELINETKIVRYIGKGNIKDNMNRHIGDDEQNKELKKLMQERTFQYKIDYALIGNETDMSNAEFTLVTHYGGLEKLYNEITPTGKFDDTVTAPF